jgi:hypothetical protein
LLRAGPAAASALTGRLSMAAKELMFFNKASNRIPRMLALVQPRESERPVVLHSLADEHANVSAYGYGCIPHAQRVIKQQLVFSDETGSTVLQDPYPTAVSR